MDDSTRLQRAQAAGFVVAGEPLAVDLADTLVTASEPKLDLLSSDVACAKWWELQADRLPPDATAPSRQRTVELRQAVRAILDAQLAGQRADREAVEVINRIVAAVPRTTRIEQSAGGWRSEVVTREANTKPVALALVAVADSLIELLTTPALKRLRRCENPACSMLFVAHDARRRFCTQNICANRVRVARHYRRRHQS